MAEQTQKALLVPMSEDGDAFEIGDLCAFESWDGMPAIDGIVSSGSAYLGVIQSIDNGVATMALVDTFFNETGGTCAIPLSQLREYNLPGTADTTEDLVRLGHPDAPETNNDITPPVDSVMPEDDPNGLKATDDPDDFAYVPDPKSPSTWKLDISDETHISDAITALTKGFRGKKVDIPTKKLASVKAKIKTAINSKIDDKDKKAALLARLDGKSPDASKALPTNAVIEIDVPSVGVKALDDSGDKVGGYLVLWGDPEHRDLENRHRNGDGSMGEFFTKSTDFALDLYQERPIFYHHGNDDGPKYSCVGWIKSIQADEFGLWVEGQLNKRNRYNSAVKQLVIKNAVGWSSGSLPHLVKRKANGEIVAWPLVEGSITPTPAEPRGTDVVPIKTLWDAQSIATAFKALNLPVEKLQLPAPEDEHEGDEEIAKPVNAPVEAVKTVNASGETHDEPNSTVEENEMVAQPLNAEVVADFAAAVKSLGDYLKLLPSPAAPAATTPAPDAGKSLTVSGLPVPDSHDGGFHVTVADEAKYNGMKADDVAMMYMLLNGAANGERANLVGGSSDFGRMAKRLVDGWNTDESRKMERRIAAKAHREWTYSKNSDAAEAVLTALPYKSLSDVDANNYKAPRLLQYENRGGEQWAIKANELDSSTTANAVADWVNNLWSETIIRRARISNPMLSILTQVTMPTNPFYLPIESTDPTVYYMKEGTDAAMLVLTNNANTVNLSKVSSNKLTLTAAKLGTRLGFSTETQEDALPFTIPQFNYQMKRVLQNYIDDTLINGDTATGSNTNINLIDGTPSSTTGALPSYLAFNGVRKFGLVTNTGQLVRFNSVPTLSLFRSMRFTLGSQYALDLPNLAYVIDYKTYYKMLSMPEFLTYQNLGAMGSNVTGLLPMGSPDQLGDVAQSVGMIDGIKVYVSAQIGLSQAGAVGSGGGEISGTPANNVNGTALLIDKSRWFVGFRRGVEVQSFGLPYFSDTVQMVAMARLALASFDTTCAAVGYDIIVS